MSNQKLFFDALTNVNFPPPDGLTETSLLGAISSMPLQERFNVYRNNVFHSLIEALKAAFPLVEKTVGTAGFKILAHDFAKEHLPSNPVLYTYGQHLPDFLEQYAPLSHLGYLPDLARLEVSISAVCDAPDHQPYPAQKLAALTETEISKLCLDFAPCVRIQASPWPIHMLWAFLNDKGDDPIMKPQEIMVFRHDFSPIVRLLPPGGFTFLEALKAGKTLGESMQIVEASGTVMPPESMQSIFNDVMQHDLVKSVTIKG